MHVGQRNFKLLCILPLFAAALLCQVPSRAQLKTYSLPENHNVGSVSKPKSAAARTAELIPKNLPFWDDFSFTPVDDKGNSKSNYPVDSLWVNNNTVWINNGIGINPPSVNVATFDGLNASFLPYTNQLLTNGMRDTLVSQPIKMSEADVTIAERASVYLSFFYQWQGNGEAPDPTDYMLLEFKTDVGQWETILKILPKASFVRTEFYDTLIKVDGDRFFHDSFQFRFANYGRQSGPYDTWNIDYVYLNKNRNVSETDFPDQAISSTLTSLFNSYQSIPYDHFLTSGALQSPKFDVYNVLDDFTDVTYLTEATFTNYSKNGDVSEVFVSNLGGTDTSAINNDGSGIIFPLEKRQVTMAYIPNAADPAQFDPDASSVKLELKVRLFTGDTFDPKTGELANDYDVNFLPIDFRVNDTIRATYILNDYYAYDDGIAEYAAGLTQAGNRAAVQFEMLTSDPDTLIGIDIYVPDYGLTANLTTDFTVYKDNGGVPGEVLYTVPSFSVLAKGPNNFQFIKIGEPFLVDTKFYVGWKAPVGGSLKVGLDYNNNAGDKIFVNTNGTWTSTSDINGSLMIRPVFGIGEIVLGITEEETVGIFPNPNDGTFVINSTFDVLEIFTTTGRAVSYQLESSDGEHKVRLHQASPGLYILRIQQGNNIRAGKIIVK
ncbi:MAG: T9SS type A sorting domain-containing protein [Chryseolinea sp.]